MIRLLTALLLTFSTVLALAAEQVARPEPYRILVVATDSSRLPGTWSQDFVSKIELPGVLKESLQISVVTVASADTGLRNQLKDRLQAAVSQDPINALVLAIPAKTTLTRDNTLVTEFENIGALSEGGVDLSFDDVFSSLKGKLAADAQITMAGCVGFCGSPEQIQKRSQSLFGYFGVANGTATIFDLADEKETRVGSEVQGPAKVSLSYRKWIRAATFVTVLGAFLGYNNSIWGIAIGGTLANWISIKLPFVFDSMLTKISWDGAKMTMTSLRQSKIASFAVHASTSIFDWITFKAKSLFSRPILGGGSCEAVFL